jgi:hypothetical protein
MSQVSSHRAEVQEFLLLRHVHGLHIKRRKTQLLLRMTAEAFRTTGKRKTGGR